MSARIVPTAAKYASCPYDGEVLAFYAGQFESVCVLLHPFMRPTNLDIERFCHASWPSKQEIVSACEAVSWREILHLMNFQSLSEIDIALRTSIGELNENYAKQVLSEKLCAVTAQNVLVHPQEGELPPLLENKLYAALKQIGHKWLWLSDELSMEHKLHWIDDLMIGDEIPVHGHVFAHDHSFLVTTHWDSHCSFLCASKALIEKVLAASPMDGFYCTSNTQVFWSVHEI